MSHNKITNTVAFGHRLSSSVSQLQLLSTELMLYFFSGYRNFNVSKKGDFLLTVLSRRFTHHNTRANESSGDAAQANTESTLQQLKSLSTTFHLV